MKTIHKFFVSLSLVVVFLFGPAARGTYRAEAVGVFTMDIQNILQNILQYLTALDALDLDEEQTKALQEKIGKFTNALKTVMDVHKGLSAAVEVGRVAIEIADESQKLLDYTDFFMRNGYSTEVIVASRLLVKEFGELVDDVQKDFQKMQEAMSESNENNPSSTGVDLSYFVTLQEYMYKYRAKVKTISWHYRSEMSKLYRQEMMRRQALANLGLRRTRIY